MMRMTRKRAAEVAEQLHIDEDELLNLPDDDDTTASRAKGVTPEPSDRPALGELAPNSADSKSHSDDAQALGKSTRGTNGGRKRAVKNGKSNASSTPMLGGTASFDNDSQEGIPADIDSTPSPASEKAAEELMKDFTHGDGATNIQLLQAADDTRSADVRSTRRQSKGPAEPESLVDGLEQEQVAMRDETMSNDTRATETTEPMHVNIGNEPLSDLDPPTSPLPSAIPNVISRLRVDTPSKRSTSNKENVEPSNMTSPQPPNYDHLEEAVVAGSSPAPVSRPTTSRAEDSIVALDELDDAVEDVSKDIPEVQTSPQKPKTVVTPSKDESTSPQEAPASASGTTTATPPKRKEKPAPVVRTTKAAAARISMAHNKDTGSKTAPSLGRPRQSMALGRASSVREVSGSRLIPAGKRVTSTSSTKDDQATEGEKKEVVIPHSKPRPISMSFPTPPPPPKSTKAPTQSTFQLPGEAVAAKLRAAREARQQKEAQEDEQKKTFKARPAPSMLNKAPSVRQTTASRARESIMTGKDLRASTSTSAPAHGRAKSVATTRPSQPQAASKESSRLSMIGTKPNAPSTTARPRPSTSLANISKPRQSLNSSTSTTIRAPSNPTSSHSTSINKGKEVFNRAAVAKANAAKEKTDREEAAKKARQEAAERSRQLSREFAEKQKAKKTAAAVKEGKGKTPGVEESTEVAGSPPSAKMNAVGVA